MVMQRFTNPRLPVMLTGTLLALYACSFQDFAYLDGGGGSAGSGKGGTGNGGTSGSSNASGSGGDAGAGGSAGTTELTGGTSGEEAGQGGEAGAGGTPSEGGSPSEGGAPAGGTSAGTTSAGGTASAGAPNENAGEGGTGGSGGSSGSGGSGGSPPLVGNLLQNPGFQLALTGWSVDPPTATQSTTRYVYTQVPNPDNGTGSSLATWHQTAEYSVFVSQNVSGLVPGTYTFKGFLSTQRTVEAYLFARNCGGEELKAIISPVSYEWFEVSIPSIPVSGSSCEVGLFVHNVAEDWVNADEFSFEKDP